MTIEQLNRDDLQLGHIFFLAMFLREEQLSIQKQGKLFTALECRHFHCIPYKEVTIPFW